MQHVTAVSFTLNEKIQFKHLALIIAKLKHLVLIIAKINASRRN